MGSPAGSKGCTGRFTNDELNDAFLKIHQGTPTINPMSTTYMSPKNLCEKAKNSKARQTTLPVDSNDRKNYPILRGCLRYFAAALAGVSRTSKVGNDKHNPGEEMHHARGKSTDHGDCIVRHLMDVEDLLAARARGDSTVTDQQILDEAGSLCWRALAFSQELHEQLGAPMAPGAKK